MKRQFTKLHMPDWMAVTRSGLYHPVVSVDMISTGNDGRVCKI